MVLFINGRCVESSSLRKALEGVYVQLLPKVVGAGRGGGGRGPPGIYVGWGCMLLPWLHFTPSHPVTLYCLHQLHFTPSHQLHFLPLTSYTLLPPTLLHSSASHPAALSCLPTCPYSEPHPDPAPDPTRPPSPGCSWTCSCLHAMWRSTCTPPSGRSASCTRWVVDVCVGG